MLAGKKAFEEALNAIKFLEWLKKFGPAKNILGPVEGQGIIFLGERPLMMSEFRGDEGSKIVRHH